MKGIPIRQHARICIPGVLVSRGIRALLRPLELAGPEIVKRLEQRPLLLADTKDLSRVQRAMRLPVMWLLATPRTEPLPIETSLPTQADQKVIAAFQAGFPPDTEGLLGWETPTIEGNRPTPHQGCCVTAVAPQLLTQKGDR
ncbi:hypothetical protein [Profundibacter sp.]